MDREQYMRELEARLSNRVPGRELENILRYYVEFFDEMGPERECDAIRELGSPAELTARIMGEQKARAPEPGYEKGYEPPRQGLSAVWKVIIAICAAPIAIPLMLALLAVAFGMLCAILGLFVGLVAGGVVCVAYGLFAAVAGFSAILMHGVSTTMFFVGGGMLMAGAGVLLVTAGTAIAGACLRGLARLLGRALRGREYAI